MTLACVGASCAHVVIHVCNLQVNRMSTKHMQRFEHMDMQSVFMSHYNSRPCNNIQLLSLVLKSVKLHLSSTIYGFLYTIY